MPGPAPYVPVLTAATLFGNPGTVAGSGQSIKIGANLSLSTSGTLSGTGGGGGGVTIAAGTMLGNPGTAASTGTSVAIGSGLTLSGGGTLSISGGGGASSQQYNNVWLAQGLNTAGSTCLKGMVIEATETLVIDDVIIGVSAPAGGQEYQAFVCEINTGLVVSDLQVSGTVTPGTTLPRTMTFSFSPPVTLSPGPGTYYCIGAFMPNESATVNIPITGTTATQNAYAAGMYGKADFSSPPIGVILSANTIANGNTLVGVGTTAWAIGLNYNVPADI